MKEGEGASKEKKNNEKGGDVKKGNATPSNKVGDFNPSYVLCRASDGHVYAKFVGSPYEYIEFLFGFLRPLSLTSKDPLQNGYLNQALISCRCLLPMGDHGSSIVEPQII